MILDSLENAGLYESVQPHFKQAFEFIKSYDLETLSLGKYELDGKNLFVNVVEVAGKTADEAKMETHQNYIDIQIPVNKTEIMGWISAGKLTETVQEYNPEKDIAFFADKATNFLNVQPKEFVIFFPTDAHQPGIAEGLLRKIIVKILV